MKILLSIGNLGIGGAQLFVLRFASALSKEHEVIIYDHRPEIRNQKFVQENLSPKVKVLSFASDRLMISIIWKINAVISSLGFSYKFRDKLNEKACKKIVHMFSPDIVSSHLAPSDAVMARVLANSKIPLTVTLHGCYDLDKYTENSSYVRQSLSNAPLVAARLNGLIYLTDKSLIPVFKNAASSKKISFKKIYNGFDFPELPASDFRKKIRNKYSISEGAIVFGMIGRGVGLKGWEEAIRAFMKVTGSSPKTVFLLLIGESEYLDGLKEKYRSHPGIIFYGSTTVPTEILQAIDIGVLPSYRECLPNSVVEYLFCGKPVIATNVGEIAQMIVSGSENAGIIVPMNENGPDEKSLCDAMLRYLHEDGLLQAHSALTKEATGKFDMKKCVGSYVELFQELISDRKIK